MEVSAIAVLQKKILGIFCLFSCRVSLMLNSEPVISIGGTNNTSGSNSIILPLNRGDRVYLQLMRGQLIELNDNTYSFTG